MQPDEETVGVALVVTGSLLLLLAGAQYLGVVEVFVPGEQPVVALLFAVCSLALSAYVLTRTDSTT